MSSMMKDWIAPTILDGLSSASIAFRSQYIEGQTLQKYPYDCSPTGVTVHFKRSRKVQLIEYNGKSHDSFHATLSDGTTKIRAIFTLECAAEFRSRRDSVVDTTGAVLHILEYYLTYRPRAPSSEKLSLQVTNFKKLGCDGERTFGIPAAIEKQEGLWGVLTELDNILSRYESSDMPMLDDALEIQSQTGDVKDAEDFPIASISTQTKFATQLVVEQSGIDFDAAVKDAKDSPTSQCSDLLSRLGVLKQDTTMSGSKGNTSIVTTSSKMAANTTSILQPVSESRKAAMSSNLDSKANSQSSLTSSDSKELGHSREHSVTPLSSDRNLTGDSEKENSQEGSREMVWEPVLNKSPVLESAQRDPSDVLMDRSSEHNPFEGMKRVPRSLVEIPKYQQALLNSVDSWWEPESSGRATFANLPPEVIQDLQSCTEPLVDGLRVKIAEKRASAATETTCLSPEKGDSGQDDACAPHEDTMASGFQQDGVDEPVDDEESILSWSESDYDDSGQNSSQGLLDEEDFVGHQSNELEQFNGKRTMISDLIDYEQVHPLRKTLESQESLPTSPTNWDIYFKPKLKPRIDYTFPSSSPGNEEELELAVPNAIGDLVNDDDDEVGSVLQQEPFRDFPSTAMGERLVIQVEKTPDHNVLSEARPFTKLHDQKRYQITSSDSQNIDDHTPSNPIVPATFDDSSQQHSSSFKTSHPISSSSQSGPAHLTAEEQQSIWKEYHEDEVFGDETPDDQLLAEFESSQCARRIAVRSSPPSSVSSPDQKSPRSLTQSTPTKDSSVSLLPHLEQQPVSSLFYTAPSETRSELGHLSPSSEKTQFLQRKNDSESHVAKLGHLTMHKSLNTKASQSQPNFRDVSGLVRAARHSFYDKDLSAIEGSPSAQLSPLKPLSPALMGSEYRDVGNLGGAGCQNFLDGLSPYEAELEVQIARSQPLVLASDRRPPDQTSEDVVFLQSSGDLVSSTIPERSDQLLQADQKASDLRVAATMDPARPTIPNSLQSPGDSDIEIETLKIVEDLEMAVLPLSSPSQRQRESRDASLVSAASDSDESNSDDADDEGLETRHAIILNNRKMDDEEMSDVPKPPEQPEPLKDPEVHNESKQSHSTSPQLTAFDSFMSVYPSYEGNEKNFIWALVYIDWLVETKGQHFLKASQWDDFIRFLAAEYMEYIKIARQTGDSMMTGFECFNMMDKDPIFSRRHIEPKSLNNDLSTLDSTMVHRARLQFKKAPLRAAGLPTTQSPHETLNIAPDIAQLSQTVKHTNASVFPDNAGQSESVLAPESKPSESPKHVSLKRPFLETQSQLAATKKARILDSLKTRQNEVDTLRTSETRQSLAQASGSESSEAKPLDRPSMAAPVSSRVKTAPATTKVKQTSIASNSICDNSPCLVDNGRRSRSFDTNQTPSKSKARFIASTNPEASGSPILGTVTPKSRSFDVNDIRVGSIGASPLFRTSRAPASEIALLQHSSTAKSQPGEVKGWLENRDPGRSSASKLGIATPKALIQKESLKRKRDSGLELLDLQSSGLTAKMKRVSTPLSKPRASSSTFRVSTAAGATTGSRKLSSYREFLEKKSRERGETSKPSTPSSKATDVGVIRSGSGSGKHVERRSVKHAEPETQAWDA